MGLPHLDAKVFAALIFLNTSGAKELIGFVQISKPSVYESLQRLEERGLVVKMDVKPALFSPVSPRVAIDILVRENTRAADIAYEELIALAHNGRNNEENDAIWTVFGPKNIEHQIREMISVAEDKIECMMGEKYLSLFENQNINASLFLRIISESPEIVQSADEILKGTHHSITFLPLNKMEELGFPLGRKERKLKFFDLRNSFELIIDNRETLSIPPLHMNKTTGLYSTNEVLVCIASDRMQSILSHILKDDESDDSYHE